MLQGDYDRKPERPNPPRLVEKISFVGRFERSTRLLLEFGARLNAPRELYLCVRDRSRYQDGGRPVLEQLEFQVARQCGPAGNCIGRCRRLQFAVLHLDMAVGKSEPSGEVANF